MSAGNVIKKPSPDEGAAPSSSTTPTGGKPIGVGGANGGGYGSGSVVKQPVVAAQEEARRIVAEADAYSAERRAEADRTFDERRAAAHREGYDAGLAELNGHLLLARETYDNALRDAEGDLLTLAVKIAERIIGREVKQKKETVADVAATALLALRREHESTLTLRVHPSDVALVQEEHQRLESSARAQFLHVVADGRVARGGCVIETDRMTIDARLETQLRAVGRALTTQHASDQEERGD